MKDSAKGLLDTLMDLINGNKDHKWDADIQKAFEMLEYLLAMARPDEDVSDYQEAINIARQALEEQE